jgi:hypothetical protein
MATRPTSLSLLTEADDTGTALQKRPVPPALQH